MVTAVIGLELKLGTVRRNASASEKGSVMREISVTIFSLWVSSFSMWSSHWRSLALLGGNGTDDGLYLLRGRLASPAHKGGDVKGFSGMVYDVACDGKLGLSEHIAERVVELQVGNCQAILDAVFLPSLHVGQLAETSRILCVCLRQ